MSSGDSVALRIGVLSDTHGCIAVSIFEVFEGVDHIIHAGDVGCPAVLARLGAIAPVTAVLGNMDHPGPGMPRRPLERVVLGGVRFLVTHRAADVPRVHDADVVVTGHTHKPAIHRSPDALHLNPGSALEPRGQEGPTVALVNIVDAVVDVQILPLEGC